MVTNKKRPSESANKRFAKKTKVQTSIPSPEEESLSEGSNLENSESSGDELDELPRAGSDSEDELDELDGNDELDDEDNYGALSGSEGGSGAPDNSKSAKESHAEQRKLLATRKRQRNSGVEVEQIKRLWEKLRVKKPTPPKEVRDKLCNEIWELSKDIVLDLVLKHDASRVVQTLIKYSSKERRDEIVKSLKGAYYPLATSSYGKYLLVKLSHYGSKESRSLIFDELHGKFRKLMRHKEGAYVVEDLFVLYASNEQKEQMVREFWGSEYAVFKDSGKGKSVLEVAHESAERKQLIMRNLYGTISASVEKGSTGFQVLHSAMKDYVSILADDLEANDSQIREFIDLLSEQFAELVHTNEGSHVACTLIAMANAKERKVIIRSMRDHSKELIRNEYGNTVLTTVFMTVDDTVLVHKSLNSYLFTNENIPGFIKDKFSRRPLLYVLKGLDGRYFSPFVKKDINAYEKIAYEKTSKKPQEQRRHEILDRLLPVLYEGIISTHENEDSESTMDEMLSANIAAQFISELILTPTESVEVNETLRPKLLDLIFEKSVKGDVREDFHFINKVPFISRLLKSLIQGNEYKWNNDAKKLQKAATSADIPGVGAEFAVRIVETILESKDLDSWLQGQACFIIVSLYEVLKLSGEKKKFKALDSSLKKSIKTLKKNENEKGAKLLLSMLQ